MLNFIDKRGVDLLWSFVSREECDGTLFVEILDMGHIWDPCWGSNSS